MRRLFALALASAALLAAQDAQSLSGWQFYKEIPAGPDAGLATLALDTETLAHIRDDGADLRVYDAAGKETPYGFRVLQGGQTAESLKAEEVHRGAVDDVSEVTLDLGENPGLHNQVEIETEGESFRRQAAVFGSDDAQEWVTLVEQAPIFRLTAKRGTTNVNRVPYPLSRYRYLRITVAPDQQVDDGAPVIESATVRLAAVVRGEEQSVPIESAVQEVLQGAARPTSRYRMDLPGRIPIHALRFTSATDSFVRPYRLDVIEGANILPLAVASGQLVRPEGSESGALMLRFREVYARQLLLTVVDDRNPPLDVLKPVVMSATRQLVVDLDSAIQQPLRLYYGNPAATAPNHNLESAPAEDAPVLTLGAQQLNPAYVAPEPSLTERAPWLVYVVLGAATIGLLAILRSLVFDVA